MPLIQSQSYNNTLKRLKFIQKSRKVATNGDTWRKIQQVVVHQKYEHTTTIKTMKRFIVQKVNGIGLWNVIDTLSDTSVFRGNKKQCTFIAEEMNKSNNH